MNKSELINAMSEETGLTKVDCKKSVEAFVNIVSNELKDGGKVALVGFGTFSISERQARTGRNPQTGKEIEIPAKNAVKFKAGSELSSSVN